MKIITTPDRRLREKSEKVRAIDFEVLDIISDMRKLSTDWEAKHPYELSAATALINPEVTKTEGKTVTDYEGCLSVPKIYGMVPRPFKVRVKAKLEDGKEVRIKATGEMARTLLHEIDHLNGILFIDHIKDKPDAFYYMDKNGELKPVKNYEKEIKNNAKLWGEE